VILRGLPTALAAGFLGLAAAGPLAAQDERPRLAAGALPQGLRLDGLLDEPAWLAADSIADLTRIEPEVGGPTTGRTVVRVLADRTTLVVGVVCYDPNPGGIVSFSKARDSDLDDEDHVLLVFDTFLDGRSGYVLGVNPAGSRSDGLITNQGEGTNDNWDTVWEATSARGAWGWSVEIRIPVRSLIFGRGLDAWGLNIQRRIERAQETSRWSGLNRDYEITQTSRAGLLTGLPAFDLGIGLTVRPALVAGFRHPPESDVDPELEPSLDANQRIGANLLASLTINTDFAETEADARRVNLTRFPLFYPEKRTFFLEGTDIFDFGLGASQDVIPFFSRRIGLFEGRQVPISLGGKLNGRAGSSNIGALLTRTRDVEELVPGATMGAARLRQNVLQESSIGAILTTGDPQGRPGAWTAGLDATFQTSRFAGGKNFLVGVWGLATDRDDLSGDKTAIGAKIDYPNDLIDAAFTWKRIGESFDPSLGFVPRSDVHLFSLGVNYQPRPGKWGIRQLFFENRLTLATDLSGEWETYRYFLAPLNARLESGDRFEANIVPQGERLEEPFEVADGVVIPPGTYHFVRYRLEVETADKRPVGGQVRWWFGGFYSGTLHQLELEGRWNPSAVVGLSLNAERNIGDLPEGDFTTTLVSTRLRINFSPDLQLSSFIQYEDESHVLGTNTRLRWTFHPLGDFFLVYNHNLEDEETNWVFQSNELIAKVQYSLRF
jgi:hypothetical protein